MQLTNIVVTHQSRCFGALLNDNQMEAVRELYKNKNIAPNPCTSASGHEFFAYPAYMRDVRIGGCKFEKFYYYLVAERLHRNRKIALLGDEFIDCCGIHKKPHGNIIISDFDFSSYCLEQNMISTEEIMATV